MSATKAGQAQTDPLSAGRGSDHEILARKISKTDCRDWEIFTSWKGHFWPKNLDGFSSHLGGGASEQVWHLSHFLGFCFLKASLIHIYCLGIVCSGGKRKSSLIVFAIFYVLRPCFLFISGYEPLIWKELVSFWKTSFILYRLGSYLILSLEN